MIIKKIANHICIYTRIYRMHHQYIQYIYIYVYIAMCLPVHTDMSFEIAL